MAEPLVYQGTITLPTGVAAQGNIIVTPTNPLPVTASTASPSAVQGNVASGTADSGNPVKIAGVYSAALPTFTTGQRGDLQLTSRGSLRAFISGATISSTNFGNLSKALVNGEGNDSNAFPIGTSNFLSNASSQDQAVSIQGAASTGNTGVGVTAVEEAGRTFSNITTATTTTPKSGKGFLHTLTVNTFVASATITIYDNTAASGSKIATITLPSTITSLGPLTMTYDVAFGTGLTIVTSGATDITIAYR